MTESRLRPGEGPRLRQVGVVVGDDAGIEADNLRFCLEALLSAPPFGRAVPIITRTVGNDLSLAWLEVEDGRPDD